MDYPAPSAGDGGKAELPGPQAPADTRAPPPPRFTTGSIVRHVLVMTATGGIGLIAIFFGDLANVLFLSQLGDHEIVAAVGYASAILFLATSSGIGLSIAATALIAPALGRSDRPRARRLSASAHVYSGLAGVVIAILLWLVAPSVVAAMGASGRTFTLALRYLNIQLPSMVLLTIGFASSAVLRSAGDARRAMMLTLIGAAFNLTFDPLFIFVFKLGLDGAAWASVLSRCAFAATGLWCVIGVHGLMRRPEIIRFLADAPVLTRYAGPAVLTNLATPVAGVFVTRAMAVFSDQAVAGLAITGRISQVAFGALFALSGAMGPIVGQNLGARNYGRVEEAFNQSLKVNAAFTLVVWLLLIALAPFCVWSFGATGDAATLVLLFCRWLAPLFGFLGALFIANAVFNVLGTPHYATAFNWGRATLGTVPFVWLGAKIGGAGGVMAGQFLGGIVFSLLAVEVARRQIRQLGHDPRSPSPVRKDGSGS